MKQYLDLLQNILDNGIEKESGRENMPKVIGISNATIRMDMKDGFPLLTTKKMYLKGIIHELLWFLRGETNIKYLVDNNVNIWNGDAYRWYLKYLDSRKGLDNQESFIEAIKNNINGVDVRTFEWFPGYHLGDLGKVYGYQWRKMIGEKTDDELYENYLKSVKSQDIS